jgi:endonuclease/exonuclease/phosphatase family metal-dependent hydrolase
MLRVISYNIRFDNPQDAANGWPHRQQQVADLLSRYEPALIGLQEALLHQLSYLSEELAELGAFGVGRDDGASGGEYNPILFRRSGLRLHRQETFWLSRTPEVAGSKSWGSDCRRIVTWGEFEERRSGSRFFLFNTHLDNKSSRAREEGARLLRSRIEAVAGGHPAIVTGDFNTTAGSRPYRILTEPGAKGFFLQDAHTITEAPHEGPAGTLNLNFGEPLGAKIDFIFVTPGVEVLRHAILADSADGRFPSDHLPVLADVRLPGRGSPRRR